MRIDQTSLSRVLRKHVSVALTTLLAVGALQGTVTSAHAQIATATPGVCYASTGNNDGGRLITIDLATGVGTLVGPTTAAALPALAINSSGEIFVKDETYNYDLYRIDALNGTRSFVGQDSTENFFAAGMAVDASDVLYGIGWSSGKLYTIDTMSGVSSLIALGTPNYWAGMAFDPTSGLLYGSLGSGRDQIYTIDKSTGVATLLGSTGLGGATPDIAFDADGNLYGLKGGGGGISNLISIDKTTGAGTVIGPIGFVSVSGMDCYFSAPPLTCSGFMQPFDQPLSLKNKTKRAIPVGIELIDADGYVITDLDIVAPPVINVSFYGGGGGDPTEINDLLPLGSANEDNIFRYDSAAGAWVYNLGTKQFPASGTYTVTVVSGDESEYTINTPNGACSQTFTRLE